MGRGIKMKGLTVYDWLGISEEDFAKIRAKGKCVKCEKLTTIYENLCHGHKIAYHRWRNKKEKELQAHLKIVIHENVEEYYNKLEKETKR